MQSEDISFHTAALPLKYTVYTGKLEQGDSSQLSFLH